MVTGVVNPAPGIMLLFARNLATFATLELVGELAAAAPQTGPGPRSVGQPGTPPLISQGMLSSKPAFPPATKTMTPLAQGADAESQIPPPLSVPFIQVFAGLLIKRLL